MIDCFGFPLSASKFLLTVCPGAGLAFWLPAKKIKL